MKFYTKITLLKHINSVFLLSFNKLIKNMNKFHKFIYLLLFILYILSLSASAYNNFDDNYEYIPNNEKNNIDFNSSDENEEILFIVDFSNSMNEKIDFAPKVYHAIEAIKSILNESGNRIKIGLRIFGVTDKPIIGRDRDGYYWKKENLCSASTLVMPISRYNNSNISSKLSQYKPMGVSPIGYSLKQAVQNDFTPSASLKHIILVTDGGENCNEDPCHYIKKIMSLRNDIKIDVIGITVNENAFSQLSCIANASNGKYYQINKQEDFKAKFQEALYSEKDIPSEVPAINMPTAFPSNSGIKYKNFVLEFDD